MRQISCFLIFVFILSCGLAMPVQCALAADPQETPQETRPAGKILRLGIVPFYSAQALLRAHVSLRDYLSRSLGMDVVVYSARSHRRFLENTLDAHYDIVITAPHFLSVLADGGFTPLVRYRNPLEFLLVVRKDSSIAGVEDLRGRRIGLPDRLSFYHILGMQWLNTLELRPGEDYVLSEQVSHMTILQAVDAGRLDVAVSGRPPLMLLNPDLRNRLKALDVGHSPLPSLVTLVRRDLGAMKIKRIRAALEAFSQSQEGKQFFADSGYGGYVPVTAEDVQAARVYEPLLRQLMSSQDAGSQ